jgi:hypothetical protein
MHTTGSTQQNRQQRRDDGSPSWSVQSRPMMSAMTTVARIWSARARSGRPPSRPQTMQTMLTQTPPFISGNRACEPGFTGVGALATFPNLPGRNDFVFVPALVLAGAPMPSVSDVPPEAPIAGQD